MLLGATESMSGLYIILHRFNITLNRISVFDCFDPPNFSRNGQFTWAILEWAHLILKCCIGIVSISCTVFSQIDKM